MIDLGRLIGLGIDFHVLLHLIGLLLLLLLLGRRLLRLRRHLDLVGLTNRHVQIRWIGGIDDGRTARVLRIRIVDVS